MSHPTNIPCYQVSGADALDGLNSSLDGLPADLATQRLAEFGPNELEIQKPSIWMRLLRQFHNALVYILLVAIALTGTLGMWMDMAVIAGVVVLNVVIGFLQEGKAEASLEALKRTLVARSGKRFKLDKALRKNFGELRYFHMIRSPLQTTIAIPFLQSTHYAKVLRQLNHHGRCICDRNFSIRPFQSCTTRKYGHFPPRC